MLFQTHKNKIKKPIIWMCEAFSVSRFQLFYLYKQNLFWYFIA